MAVVGPGLDVVDALTLPRWGATAPSVSDDPNTQSGGAGSTPYAFPVNAELNDKICLWYVLSSIILLIGKIVWCELTSIRSGEIWRLKADIIVNSTNETLDEQHRTALQLFAAAGPGLRAECKDVGQCRAGEVKITKGHNLPSKYCGT